MRSILLAATALVMLGGAAYADSNSASGSNSNATVTTTSGSQAVASPTVNVNGTTIGNGNSQSRSNASAVSNTRSSSTASANPTQTATQTSSNATTVNVSEASGSSGTTGMNYSGSYTVRNTPEVIPPNVVGGNPCAVGASGGIALPGFGLAAGGTWADKACERRQQAALLFNMGEQKVAIELMCQDDNVRSAMRVGGKPCVMDVAVAESRSVVADSRPAMPAPSAAVMNVASVAPAAATRAAPAAAPIEQAVASMPSTPRPEWCGRASPATEASRLYFQQVCGK